MLFSNVRYAISPTVPGQRQAELSKLLNANGATMVRLLEASHVVSNTIHFDGQESAPKGADIVTDEWVDRSIVYGKLQDPRLFSADPVMIFSGVILCVADLEACDKEVIAAGVNALGGLFREGYTRDCTHVLAARPGSDKYLTAMHFADKTRVKVVLPYWFDDCFKLLTRLPEEPYAWPDPPVLRSEYGLNKTRLASPAKALMKAAALEDEPADKIAAAARTESNIWQGKRILLSSTLKLEEGRLESVKASVQRAGGLIVHTSGDEPADVEDADVYITQRRVDLAFVKAFRSNKLIGTLSWLFHVHKTGVISPPQDQLIHFPPPPEPCPGFDKQKITASNYEGDARRYLKKLIELMGGEFTPQMTAANTAVVAAFIKGEKTTKAREWNIPVVNHTWLEDCFASWMLITPAQEKYVTFPPGVSFGALVGKRGIQPLTEEDLVEIERAGEEMRDRRETVSVEPIRVEVEKDMNQRTGESSKQQKVSPARVQSAQDKRISQNSPSKLSAVVVIDRRPQSGRRTEHEEEEEEEEEEYQPPRARGRPTKRRRDSDIYSEPQEEQTRVSPTKRTTRSRAREEDSEYEEVPRRPSRPTRNASASGSSPAKSSLRQKAVEEEDESGDEPPRRRAGSRRGRPAREPTPEDTIVTTSRPMTVRGKAKSAVVLLDDHEFSSNDEDRLPVKPPGKAAERPERGRGRPRKSRMVEEAEEEEDVNVDEEEAIPGPSKSPITTPQKQRTPLRKQASSSGPTPGRVVFVEIPSPQKSASSLGRMHSMGTVAADGAATNASPKRGGPVGRTSTRERENESPLSTPESLVESPSRSSRFPDDAIRRSSQPNPIITAAALQRSPSRRRAASKANAKLHENALDIIQFEKEKRTGRVRGAWEGEDKKRRASAVQDESGVEESDSRDKKRRKSNDHDINGKKGGPGKKPKKPDASPSISGDEQAEMRESEMEPTSDDLDEIRLMTTQVTLNDHILKGLRQLGVKIASKPTECNLLLANAIGRTEKFLCAMATARSIVTEAWASDSVKAKRILPTDKYFLEDSDGEKKHKFKLEDALRRAQSSDKKLLEGHTFYFTKGLHKSEKLVTYKNAISSAGGKIVLSNPTIRILKGHEKTRHVLSIADDHTITDPLADAGFHIYVPEFILVGILTQKMDWEGTPHRLDRS